MFLRFFFFFFSLFLSRLERNWKNFEAWNDFGLLVFKIEPFEQVYGRGKIISSTNKLSIATIF